MRYAPYYQYDYYIEDNGPPIHNYYDKYIKPMIEEREMAKQKRPPLKWDSRNQKAINYLWGLYVGGKPIHNIVAYDIDKRYYIYGDETNHRKVENVSFCVQRLS